MASFTVICDKCKSKNVWVCGDTMFMVHIECEDCGEYGVEDKNLSINGE